MSIFISDSVAYDTILSFNGVFANHLLAGSLEHINLTYQTPAMTKNYGGCAANIAYSLKTAGGDPLIVTTVGKDADDYLHHLQNLDIRIDGIKVIESAYTPQAFIITDRLGNQMTAFHEGAMAMADQALPGETEELEIGIVTPTATHVMMAHTRYLNEHHVPVIWDMGQASAYVTDRDIEWFIEHVDILTLSSYEWDVLSKKTGLSHRDVASKLQALIITEGSNGATLYHNGEATHYEALPIEGTAYPVGCGDAFRGGLLRALSLGWQWTDAMHLALLMGAIKAQCPQAQGYRVSTDEIAHRFGRAFGKEIRL